MVSLKGRVFIAGSHPIFVVAETAIEAVIFNATTYKPDSKLLDESCILKEGEHGAIIRDSFIYYKPAKVISKSDLQLLMDSASPSTQASPDIIEKIRRGALISPHTAPEVKRFIEEIGEDPISEVEREKVFF